MRLTAPQLRRIIVETLNEADVSDSDKRQRLAHDQKTVTPGGRQVVQDFSSAFMGLVNAAAKDGDEGSRSVIVEELTSFMIVLDNLVTAAAKQGHCTDEIAKLQKAVQRLASRLGPLVKNGYALDLMFVTLHDLRSIIREAARVVPERTIRALEGLLGQSVGKRIASGSEGDVYEFGLGRAIKFTPVDTPCGLAQSLIENPSPWVVRVFDTGTFDVQGSLIEWCVMERLKKLSSKESDAIEMFNAPLEEQPEHVPEKLREFLTTVLDRNSFSVNGYRLYDFGAGNVMKDANGDYKLVDLDAFGR